MCQNIWNLKQVWNTCKFSLNLTKTNFMIFYPRQKKIDVTVPLVMEYYNQASHGNS